MMRTQHLILRCGYFAHPGTVARAAEALCGPLLHHDPRLAQARDYKDIKDPSLLRFLADMRGEDLSGAQLRDDLMTLLIAGHETTAAVLTWAVFCLAQPQHAGALHALRAEIDEKIGDRAPTMADVKGMRMLCNVRTRLAMLCVPAVVAVQGRCCCALDALPEVHAHAAFGSAACTVTSLLP